MLVSVVIVTWNNESDIDDCLNSLAEKNSDISFETIVIDNNSSDNTRQKLSSFNKSDIKLIFNQENEGFTKASNKGINAANGKYVFLLNPDVIFTGNTIKILAEFLEKHEDYTAVSPLLINEDGSIQQSVRTLPDHVSMFYEFSLLSAIFPGSKKFGKWKMKYYSYDRDDDIIQPMAAALMVRKEFLNNINGMDERFRMFFNDVDLCKQIHDKGGKIRLIISAKLIHKKGTSIYKDRINMIKIWNEDCKKYFDKHYNNNFKNKLLNEALSVSGFLRKNYYRIFK